MYAAGELTHISFRSRSSALHFFYLAAMDKMYCAQQISIPTELPNLLKNFTKAAIRTQPKDLLLWSAA